MNADHSDEGTVEIEYNGTRYEGEYIVHKGIVTVYYEGRAKPAHLSGIPLNRLIEMQLRELVQEDQVSK